MPLRHGHTASRVRHSIRLRRVPAMQARSSAVESRHCEEMLASRCLQGLLILGQCLYDHDGYYLGCCADQCVLEAQDASFERGWGCVL